MNLKINNKYSVVCFTELKIIREDKYMHYSYHSFHLYFSVTVWGFFS